MTAQQALERAERDIMKGPSITVTEVCPSTCCPDSPGAVDAIVVYRGETYGVTLLPGEGRWDAWYGPGGENQACDLVSWGDRDNWISGPNTNSLTRAELDRIEEAVRDAARWCGLSTRDEP